MNSRLGLIATVLPALLLTLLLIWPGQAAAAEVLQVRSAVLLQVGDRNRSYPVELACVAVDAALEERARDWLRGELPRRTRVNLHPLGEHDGILVARVQRLDGDQDLGQGLIDAGLAHREVDCP